MADKKEKCNAEESKKQIAEWVAKCTLDNEADILAEMKSYSSIYSYAEIKKLVNQGIRKKAADAPKEVTRNDAFNELVEEASGARNAQVIGQTTIYRQIAIDFVKARPVYYDKTKHWWGWNIYEYKWEMIDETDLMNEFDKVYTLATEDSKIKSQILEALRKAARNLKPKEPEKTWVQFKDRIIDIITNQEFPAAPTWFICNPIPHRLGRSDVTPIIDKLFHEWVATPTDGNKWVATLYELCAYCMLADYPLSVCTALLGGGRNGKTTFINYIERLVGKDNVTEADLKRLVSERFEAWMLYRKLVCNIPEIDFGILKDTNNFKKITGGDSMKFEQKGKDGIVSKNYAKMIMAANTLPESYDKSDGFFRRWLIIDFPHKFQEKAGLLDTIPEEEYENFCRKSIAILKKVLECGTFSNQGDVPERAERYEERSNPFGMFLKECCVEDKLQEVPFWKLYMMYEDWLKQRNFRKQSKIEFGRMLRKKGFTVTSPRNMKHNDKEGNMVSWRFILGVCLNQEYDEYAGKEEGTKIM